VSSFSSSSSTTDLSVCSWAADGMVCDIKVVKFSRGAYKNL